MTEINNLLKVSVVTVVYNNAHELKITIDSIIAQKYPNVEYIIVDGGSTDGTVDVIKSYDSNIDFWISEKDAGIYDAMNKGVGFSSGDYIIFMNAGDVFYSRDSLTEAISRGACDKPDVIMASYNVHSAIRRNGIRRCQHLNNLWKGMLTCHQSILFKNDGTIFHDMKAGFAADYDLVVKKYLLGARFLICDDIVLSNYAGGGVSDKSQASVYKSWFIISKQLNINYFYHRAYYFYMYMRSLLRDIVAHLMFHR